EPDHVDNTSAKNKGDNETNLPCDFPLTPVSSGSPAEQSPISVQPAHAIFPSDSAITSMSGVLSVEALRQHNIAHAVPDDNSDSESGNSFYSDAYEDLDHIVLSPTGSGAVPGISRTTGVVAPPSGIGEAVALPGIL